MGGKMIYDESVIEQKLDDLLGMISNLENSKGIVDTSNEKMKRVILPIPKDYGGGYATGKTTEEAVQRLISKVFERIPSFKESTTPIFQNYFDEWIEIKEGQNRSPVTIADYRFIGNTYLVPWFGEMHIGEITADDIQLFYNSIIEKSKSVSTQCRAILRGMFERALRNKIISHNPMQFKYEMSKKTGESVVLQDKDLFAVIDGLERLKTPYIKDYFYACFLCFTGLRREEILGLKWGAIDFENETIHVYNAVKFPNGQNNPVVGSPKADSAGYIRLNSMLADRIKAYKQNSDYYIIGNDDPTKPITRSIFTKMWKRIKKQIDLKGATSHSFRSSYASMINAHCDHMDVKTLQTLLRHKTPDLAIRIYTKTNREKVKTVEMEYDEYLCRTYKQEAE